MNRLLAENSTTGKYEVINSTSGSLNTTGGGSGSSFDGVIKGVTDINNPTNTIKNIKVDTAGSIKVDDINISQARKTFTEGQDPSIGLGTGVSLTQQFCIIGGVDNCNSNFDQLNPCRIDTDGKLNVFATTGDISDLRHTSSNKSVATLQSEINDKITVGNATLSNGNLQQVLMYGKDSSGNLRPLDTTSQGRQIVDVIELNASGKIQSSTALSSIQLCGYREDTGNSFHTLKCSSDGILNTKQTIERGTVTVASPFVSGTTSNTIDVGDKKNFNFHMVGAGNSHQGFFVEGSNDNSTFQRVAEFLPQTLGNTSYIGGSVSKGFQYYRIENGGNDASITFSVYNLTD
jgi:hypothetical protein